MNTRDLLVTLKILLTEYKKSDDIALNSIDDLIKVLKKKKYLPKDTAQRKDVEDILKLLPIDSQFREECLKII